jgi:hypothetical protein
MEDVMKGKKFFSALLIFSLVTMACSVSIGLPEADIKVGPTQTDEINVAVPASADEATVELDFAAGELAVSSGAENALVSGTATYNVQELKPTITTAGNQVKISTGEFELKGIPKIDDEIKNEWNLQLGDFPINLKISAGAYQGKIDLGGLSILILEVNDGAAEVNLQFDNPNGVVMKNFEYTTGASKVELRGLANANFEQMTFKGGAGDFTLDFSGSLTQDAQVDINSGFGKVTIIVPEGVSAQVNFSNALSTVEASGAWEKSGDQYTQAGSGPTLKFNIEMGAGTVELKSS